MTPAEDPTGDPARGDALIAPAGGGFRDSVWNVDVTKAPLNELSDVQMTGLTSRLAQLYGGNAAFAIYQYGVSWVTVPEDQPRATVNWYDCTDKGHTPPGLFGPSGQFEDVPIPDDATPTDGTDQELTIYQPSTDTMWDFWKAQHGEDGWRACWGGRIDEVSRNDGAFPFPYGASASGLAREAGMVSINDVRSGRIDHAVALSIPSGQVARGFVWLATRSDGENTAPDAIPEGARLRLDPRLDVGSLGLTRIGTMIALAAQRYGFIVTDGSGTLTVPGEGPYAYQAAVGVDPWVEYLDGLRPSAVLANFPWNEVQVLDLDWR